MIKIIASASQKMPNGQEFGSRGAVITVEAEAADLAAVPAEAQRLLALAEAQVLQHLGVNQNQPAPSTNGRPYAARASRPSGNGRGSPRPASAAQVRYLRQLVEQEAGAEAALLQEHGIGRLEELSSRACSAAIDRLKGSAA